MNAWFKKKKKGQIEGILYNLSVWLRIIKIQVHNVLQPTLFSCMRKGREDESMVEGNSGLLACISSFKIGICNILHPPLFSFPSSRNRLCYPLAVVDH